MKSLRGICKTGTSSFLEFNNEDFYWTNGHLIAKNDPFLKKAISLGGAKDKNLRQEFYFKKGSRGFYGLQTKIIQGKTQGLLKECLSLAKIEGVEVKEIKFPRRDYFEIRGLDKGLILEQGIIIGINGDYHDYVSNLVKGGPDRIIAGEPLSYIKNDLVYAIINPMRAIFFDKDFNPLKFSNSKDFYKSLYGNKYKNYILDTMSIAQKYMG